MLRNGCLLPLLLTLCVAAFTGVSHGQNPENSMPSESISMTVLIVADSNPPSLVRNTVVEFVNATSLPFNASLPALNDRFQNAGFAVFRPEPPFSVFLRVSYNDTLNANMADAYADDVLGEFRKAFNFPLDVTNKTHDTSSGTINVYYQLSPIVMNVANLIELTKYSPTDGFGQLITPNLLGFYLQGGPDANCYVIYSVKYDLVKIDQALVWTFRLELGRQISYYGGQVDVSLNELLNRSGPITPSTQRSSEVDIWIGKREVFSKTPVVLSLNSSSPAYSSLREEGDYNVVTYNLTQPVDNVAVRIDVAPEPPSIFSLTNVAIIVSGVCIATALVTVLVRRKKLKKEVNVI
jgi:hypothetical protein